MIKYLLIILLAIVLTSTNSFAQNSGDSKIIITVTDTSNLYKRVKFAMIRNQFIVKDLETDTLQSYPLEYLTNVYLIMTSVIKRDKVELSAVMGPRKRNLFGELSVFSGMEKVVYFKGSESWDILKLIAEKIGGAITYEK